MALAFIIATTIVAVLNEPAVPLRHRDALPNLQAAEPYHDGPLDVGEDVLEDAHGGEAAEGKAGLLIGRRGQAAGRGVVP